jgi:tetratricopeptide (TPR) repeat protein
MSTCAKPDCSESGINSCSICLREPYCSGDCQKGDWKLHKAICKILKKLSLKLQPYHEVVQIIDDILEEISEKKKEQRIRVLTHLISYAKHQFGDRVPGKVYRERNTGERMDNWRIEIEMLIPIFISLLTAHEDGALSRIDRDNLAFPYFEKMLDILRPWSTCVDLNRASHIDSINKEQISEILLHLSQTERSIGLIFTRRNQFDRAENHCQQALSYARLFEGKEEDKTGLLCRALEIFCELYRNQGNFDEALTFAKEAYNCVAITYNPVHPEVQKAASMLIECLIYKDDFDHAETFAQMTLDSLKDPGNGLDQESEAVANGYYDLGLVINQQKGDYVKAEKLVRESLRIRSHLYDAHHQYLGISVSLLARILQSQGYERALAIDLKNYGSEGINTAISSFNMGDFYSLRAYKSQTTVTHLLLSESMYKESLRIYTNLYGPDHPHSVRTSSRLYFTSRQLSEI